MSVEQYWMGKGIDLESLWRDFDKGDSYIQKVLTSPLHLLRLTFAQHPPHLPLFDHEAIFKTVKGTFHDVKAECFTLEAYDEAAPIFLHKVDRGSGVFEFLAQFDPLMTWVVALGGAAMWYRNAFAADQKLDDERLAFLKKHFPSAGASDVEAYMKAWTTCGRRQVLHRLIGQHLERVEISDSPHDSVQAPTMVDMQVVVVLPKNGWFQ